jgi:uncharacterized protein YbcV (DUF1398 family)
LPKKIAPRFYAGHFHLLGTARSPNLAPEVKDLWTSIPLAERGFRRTVKCRFQYRGLILQLTLAGNEIIQPVQTMNTKSIIETAQATLAGNISFPEIVVLLRAAGVEYYHVDYVAMRKTFYSDNDETTVTEITFKGLPAVAARFDEAALRAAIADSQRNGQKYFDFTRRAMAAGVQSYIAFLRGQRVMYLGRAGEHHTEWFPGAGPHKNALL